MASAKDVPVVRTPKGVRVDLGSLYLYPDGHANLVFPPVPTVGFRGVNLPLTRATHVIDELVAIVTRMEDEIVKKRPGQS
jgi:hypothetical protein